MKVKRFICLILAVIMIITLAACAADPTLEGPSTPTLPENLPEIVSNNSYEVYLSSASGDLCLDETIDSDRLYVVPEEPVAGEKTTTIQVGDQSYELVYVHAYEAGKFEYAYEYRTEDRKVDCIYWVENMQLARIKIELDSAEFVNMDQAQYEQWIRDFVADYSDENWDAMRLYCTTYYTESGENYQQGGAAEGFHKELEENQRVTRWEFTYYHCVDGVKTSDLVSASFTPEEDKMTFFVWLNRHQFDVVGDLVLDKDAIDEAFDAFFADNMIEGYELLSVTPVGEDALQIIEGNVMLSRNLAVEYKANGMTKECSYKLLVDIPDPT